MGNFEFIIKQAKLFHFNGWKDEDMRECLDMLPTLSRPELFSLYQSKWLSHEKILKEAILICCSKTGLKKEIERLRQ